MPDTARDMGTTTAKLAQMNPVEQLDWVDQYIAMQMRNFKIDQIKDYDDLYLLVFFPKAIGKPDDWQFPGYIYSQNAGVDMDGDGKITVADFKGFIRKKVPAMYLPEFTARFRWLSPRYIIFAVLVIGVGVGAFFLWRSKTLG